MKKILKKGCILLLVLIMSACSVIKSDEQFYEHIEEILFSLSSSKEIPNTNMNKKYYQYYLPFDMKRINSSILSEEFKCGNEKMIMNFKTISFIKNAYYTDEEKEDKIVVRHTEEELAELLESGNLNINLEDDRELADNIETIEYTVTRNKLRKAFVFTGTYLANYGKHYDYVLSLRKEDNMVYMFLDGEIVSFACYVPSVECEDMIYRMFYIMKSMGYDAVEIIKDYKLLYSLKQREDYISKEDSINNENIPESGYLEDLIQRLEE